MRSLWLIPLGLSVLYSWTAYSWTASAIAAEPARTSEAAAEVTSEAASVQQWEVISLSLAGQTHADPLKVICEVTFTSPSGKTTVADAFWSNGPTWTARFSPNETGRWQWQSRSPDDKQLNSRSGRFECTKTGSDNPLLKHGPLRLSKDRRHFMHADGTPFFWLADTAWNGALRSTEQDWQTYLNTRVQQKFTAIQFVSTQWRGGRSVLDQPVFTVNGDTLTLNPDKLAVLDDRVQAIADAGLVPAPVLLWALTPEDPGEALSEEHAIQLARHLKARWGAYGVVWLLGGDGRYKDPARWQRIGRAVFPDHDRTEDSPLWRPVTLHPSGQNPIGREFIGEPWFDFVGYQSGHGAGDKELRWLTAGPLVETARKTPALPIINLEPNYEGHPAYGSGRKHTDAEVRRAAYWSLLVIPPAGVTYGNNEIWVWNSQPGPAENHPNIGQVNAWNDGLKTPGIAGMTRLYDFFTSGPWTGLRPAQQLLKTQPGEKNPQQFIAVAQTGNKAWTVAYLPAGEPVMFQQNAVGSDAEAHWFDPRTGQRTAAKPDRDSVTFTPPGSGDWVLEFRTTGQPNP